MSHFMHMFKHSTPGSPTPSKREGRFMKFKKNFTKSSVNVMDSGTNLSKKRSVSTSALTQLKEDSIDFRRNSLSVSPIPVDSNFSAEETDETLTEPKKQISVKELVEKMITHLQILERKNELLSQTIQQLNEEKTSVETDLSSVKVELNLYKNRMNQIERMADEWHCSICLDNKIKIINSKRLIVATFCGHLFCSLCAQSLTGSTRPTKSCPTCRKPLKEGQLNYHPIFI